MPGDVFRNAEVESILRQEHSFKERYAALGSFYNWGQAPEGGWCKTIIHNGLKNHKKRKLRGNQYFYNQHQATFKGTPLGNLVALLSQILKPGCTIIPVPSSDPDLQAFHGCDVLVHELTKSGTFEDGRELLKRKKKLKSKADGGSRTFSLEESGLEASDAVQGKDICLIDDVTTSGNTFDRCRTALLAKGAKNVYCFAMAKTPDWGKPALSKASHTLISFIQEDKEMLEYAKKLGLVDNWKKSNCLDVFETPEKTTKTAVLRATRPTHLSHCSSRSSVSAMKKLDFSQGEEAPSGGLATPQTEKPVAVTSSTNNNTKQRLR